MSLKPKSKADEYASLPYKIFSIEILPVCSAEGFLLGALKSKTVKIKGKATAYHTIPKSDVDSEIMFMVLSDGGLPVFELPLRRLGLVELIAQQEIVKTSLKVVQHETAKRPKTTPSGE